MFACQDVVELVTDYVEGRLTRWDTLRFRLHIAMCRVCREYVRQMRLTQAVVGRATAPPMPPEVREAMLHRFRSWRAQDGGGIDGAGDGL